MGGKKISLPQAPGIRRFYVWTIHHLWVSRFNKQKNKRKTLLYISYSKTVFVWYVAMFKLV